MLPSALDTVMDRTVLPGYTKLGFRARRALGGIAAELPRLDGRSVLVTGATAGLGLAACEGFAALGADVHLLARDAERGERARERVARAARGGEVRLRLADLSSLDSVRSFAAGFATEVPALHVLVNNAGVLLGERTLSPDGIEATFATNVLGPFLLTSILIPKLVESAPARIINVSSGGMYTERLRADDLEFERGSYDGPTAYARTKRAQIVLTEIWAEQLRSTGVVVHSMHPGWADTPGVESSLPRFYRVMKPLLRTPEEGADTIVWLGAAAEPGRTTGRFWHDRRERPTHRLSRTRETAAERERLWGECLRLSGLG